MLFDFEMMRQSFNFPPWFRKICELVNYSIEESIIYGMLTYYASELVRITGDPDKIPEIFKQGGQRNWLIEH